MVQLTFIIVKWLFLENFKALLNIFCIKNLIKVLSPLIIGREGETIKSILRLGSSEESYSITE